MPYNYEMWLKRMRLRSDISTYLTHLTRENDDLSGIDVLIKILKEKTLLGSTNSGFIQGSDRAVCFQDAPLYSITQNLIHEQFNRDELGGKIRYRPYGISFNKKYIFNKGGRPVIYEQKDIARKKYPDDLWRIVSFDLNDKNNIVDWTHEREWRVKGNFQFDLAEVTVLLTNKSAYKTFINKIDESILKNIAGIVVLDPIIS